ncbi:MAG: prepilin-type N-terminal cleavage/methylation domain-containing protein [Candidatus Hydrogenedentes bacterium]|nr:prepilin-type N-terminal cleavage/methylation domain-containing protein [Candidatus Hydrogenedentota bacterium]
MSKTRTFNLKRLHTIRACGSAGFTLVEVMIALAVLGTAIFVLLEAHYGSLRAQDTLREEVQMRNLMSEAIGYAELSVATAKLSDSQEFGRRYPGFSYSFEAQLVGESFPGLYDVMVRVEGPKETRERQIFVMTRDSQTLLEGLQAQGALTEEQMQQLMQQGGGGKLPGGMTQEQLQELIRQNGGNMPNLGQIPANIRRQMQSGNFKLPGAQE